MRTITIYYPLIAWHAKDIEISDEEFENIESDEDRLKIIWDNLSEDEQENIVDGKKGLYGALNAGLGIFKLKDDV